MESTEEQLEQSSNESGEDDDVNSDDSAAAESVSDIDESKKAQTAGTLEEPQEGVGENQSSDESEDESGSIVSFTKDNAPEQSLDTARVTKGPMSPTGEPSSSSSSSVSSSPASPVDQQQAKDVESGSDSETEEAIPTEQSQPSLTEEPIDESSSGSISSEDDLNSNDNTDMKIATEMEKPVENMEECNNDNAKSELISDRLQSVAIEEKKETEPIKDAFHEISKLSPKTSSVASEKKDETEKKKEEHKLEYKSYSEVKIKSVSQHENLDEHEAELDFEEEVSEDRRVEDMGEIKDDKEEEKIEKEEAEDDGEVEDDDDLEEGEVKEPTTSTRKPQQRPICRFFNKGQCTWGTNCRFIHPGVNDKGNYNMFSSPKLSGGTSLVGTPFGSHRGHTAAFGGVLTVAQPDPIPPVIVEDTPPVESAWERGLRFAKENLKKANRRKEMEPDFEEKRLNLSLGGDLSSDYEKENEYARSPYRKNSEPVFMYDEPDPYERQAQELWRGGNYENFEVRYMRPEYDYRHHRNVVMGKDNKEKERGPVDRSRRDRFEYARHDDRHWRDNRRNEQPPVPPSSSSRGRADEWNDPWRRSTSPKKRGRSKSYSSASSESSYSSRSSRSRSSSVTSYSGSSSAGSSYSRSTSRSYSRPRSRSRPTPHRSARNVNQPSSSRSKPQPPPSAGSAPVRKSPPQKTSRQPPPPERKPPPASPAVLPPAPPSAPPLDKKKSRAPPAPPRAPPEKITTAPSKQKRARTVSISGSDTNSSRSRSRSRSSSRSSVSSRSSSRSSSASSVSERGRKTNGTKKSKIPRTKEPQEPKSSDHTKVSVNTARTSKDPLKQSGQKPQIKLTLLNKAPASDKSSTVLSHRDSSSASKGRTVERVSFRLAADKGPTKPSVEQSRKLLSSPTERGPKSPSPVKEQGWSKPTEPPLLPASSSIRKRPHSPPIVSPTKPVGGKRPSSPPPPQPPQPPPSQPPAKKSTVSRREELLKQLKAVEDAIARKRAKLT